MQTYLSDKMPLKEVKINERKKLDFLNQHKILNFFNTLYDLFQDKKIHLSEGLFVKFFDTQPKNRNVTK